MLGFGIQLGSLPLVCTAGVLGGMDDQKVYLPPPLPAPGRDVLATPVGLPLSWSWIRGDRGDSQQVYSPPPGNKFPDKVWVTLPFQHQLELCL